MTKTKFRNPNGLPDSEQVTTAHDLVRLGEALQDRFPTYYKYFGKPSFTYRGVRHRNHNHLLGKVAGVDGIKTGYTRASGFNLVTNVERDGRHIIAVVMGGKSASSRDAHMRELIAKYLPKAKRGERTAPLVIADTGAAGVPVDLPVRVSPARAPRPRMRACSPTRLPKRRATSSPPPWLTRRIRRATSAKRRRTIRSLTASRSQAPSRSSPTSRSTARKATRSAGWPSSYASAPA